MTPELLTGLVLLAGLIFVAVGLVRGDAWSVVGGLLTILVELK